MSTTAIPATPHVSFLKRFGQEVVKIITFGAIRLEPVVKVGATVAETLLPQYAPAISAAEGIFERGLKLSLQLEADFATVGQSSNGVAKFAEFASQLGPALDQAVQSAIPGLSADALQAEAYLTAKIGVLNSFVALLNGIEAGSTAPVPSQAALSSASSIQAALKAAGMKVGA